MSRALLGMIKKTYHKFKFAVQDFIESAIDTISEILAVIGMLTALVAIIGLAFVIDNLGTIILLWLADLLPF